MNTRYLTAIAVHWVISTYLLALAGDTVHAGNHLDTVASLKILVIRELLFLKFPIPNIEYITAIGGLLTWDYPWWRHGVLSIMRYLLLLPVTITGGYYLVTQVGPRLIQMMMSLLQTTTGKGLFGLGVSAAVLTALAATLGT